jgi:hypothetical protein
MNPKKSTASPMLLSTCAIKGDRHGALFYLKREFILISKKKYFPEPLFPVKKENLSDAIDWGKPVM